MQDYLGMLPWFITSLIDSLVSLKRIENLLFQPEIDESNVKTDANLSENGINILIKNAYFGWEKDQNNINLVDSQIDPAY
jgi:predicted membrane GTPase involved in stress response